MINFKAFKMYPCVLGLRKHTKSLTNPSTFLRTNQRLHTHTHTHTHTQIEYSFTFHISSKIYVTPNILASKLFNKI